MRRSARRRACGGQVSLALLLVTASGAAHAADTWTDVFPGVKRLHRTTSNQNINALVIDLCAAGVSLRATAYSERGRTVASFGALVGAHAVINGDFFGSNYSVDGAAKSGGQLWPVGNDHAYVAPIGIGAHRVELPHHANTGGVAAWMTQVVSGHPTLLDDATLVGNSGDPLCTNRHPRTAVGLSQDHKKMIWAVVDGRASARIGMTCPELAQLLKSLGAFDAVNLDGGGSSSMWLSGKGVVNYPSDGSPRVVGNHLALFAKGSGPAAHCPCKPYCDGSQIHGADCGVGDCAVFGSGCVDDALGVRCVFGLCPASGTRKICLDEHQIATCDDGQLSGKGDCGAFAAFCSTAGVTNARCVSAFCVAGPEDVPQAHDVCLPDGKLARCTKAGGLDNAQACPAGLICTTTTQGAACADPSAPPPAAGATAAVDAGTTAVIDASAAVVVDARTDGGAWPATGDPSLPAEDAPPAGADGVLEGGCEYARGGLSPGADQLALLLLLLSLCRARWRRRDALEHAAR